jgi:hypothetical protein
VYAVARINQKGRLRQPGRLPPATRFVGIAGIVEVGEQTPGPEHICSLCAPVARSWVRSDVDVLPVAVRSNQARELIAQICCSVPRAPFRWEQPELDNVVRLKDASDELGDWRVVILSSGLGVESLGDFRRLVAVASAR